MLTQQLRPIIRLTASLANTPGQVIMMEQDVLVAVDVLPSNDVPALEIVDESIQSRRLLPSRKYRPLEGRPSNILRLTSIFRQQQRKTCKHRPFRGGRFQRRVLDMPLDM